VKRERRTDAHRPGVIIPADYEAVLNYSLATSDGGWPIPAIGINCEIDKRIESKDAEGKLHVENGKHAEGGQCCVLGLMHVARVKWAPTGCIGQCSICGARYVYGDVWKHVPSGEHLHVGHDCADKYAMLMDRSAWELENGRVRQAAATAMIREQNREERAAFLAANPGLEEAFNLAARESGLIRAHNDSLPEGAPDSSRRFASRALEILSDLAEKFARFRSLSEKQVALVLKLAHEVAHPKAPEVEQHVPAPEGKVTVRGKVVSRKTYEGAYGSSLKITVKIQTPEGSWLAWGTAPRALWDVWSEGETGQSRGVQAGDEVEFTATLKQGREPHFALFKRPTAARFTRRWDASWPLSARPEQAPAPAVTEAVASLVPEASSEPRGSSGAASLESSCPSCSALAGEPCKSAAGKKVHTHAARKAPVPA
jgi:hypothetical protein